VTRSVESFPCEPDGSEPLCVADGLYPVDFGTTLDEGITIVVNFPEGIRLKNLPEEVELVLPVKGALYAEGPERRSAGDDFQQAVDQEGAAQPPGILLSEGILRPDSAGSEYGPYFCERLMPRSLGAMHKPLNDTRLR